MNKKTYIALIIILAGIALFGLGLFFSHGNIKSISANMNTPDDRKTYECTSKIDVISITENSNGVKIETGNVSVPTISYMEGKSSGKLIIEESGNSVSFVRESPKVSINITIMDFTDYATVLTLPANYSGSLNIVSTSGSVKASDKLALTGFTAESSSGSLHISNLSSDNNIILKSTSGAIKFNDCSANGNISASASSGSITFENLSSGKDLEANTTSGAIRLTNVSCGNDLEIEASSGSVTVDNASVTDNVKLKATSGAVRFTDLKAGKDIELRCSSGSIHGNILGKESDYSIISSTGSGSSNLKDSRSGSKNLDVTTSSGSIKIEFTE